VKTPPGRSKNKLEPRVQLTRLLEQIRKDPSKFLAERSVYALDAFFNGYGIHGSPNHGGLALDNQANAHGQLEQRRQRHAIAHKMKICQYSSPALLLIL
jgi:hypothetical protein